MVNLALVLRIGVARGLDDGGKCRLNIGKDPALNSRSAVLHNQSTGGQQRHVSHFLSVWSVVKFLLGGRWLYTTRITSFVVSTILMLILLDAREGGQ